MAVSPYFNPSAEQERAWERDRLAALERTRAIVDKVLSMKHLADRRKFLASYREQMGDVCADALESRVRSAWEKGGGMGL